MPVSSICREKVTEREREGEKKGREKKRWRDGERNIQRENEKRDIQSTHTLQAEATRRETKRLRGERKGDKDTASRRLSDVYKC